MLKQVNEDNSIYSSAEREKKAESQNLNIKLNDENESNNIQIGNVSLSPK